MKSVEESGVLFQTPKGFNDGMDVIKPLRGLDLLDYASPAFHAGLLKLKPVGLLKVGRF